MPSDASPDVSPYAPRPARAQAILTRPAEEGLLPVGGKAKPHLRRPCVLIARRERAEWSPVHRDFLPVLDQIPVLPGANGVGERKDPITGAIVEDVSALVSDYQRRGWRVLVNGEPALHRVVTDGLFLRTYDCQRGLKATVPMWEEPEQVVEGEEVRWRVDHDRRREFLHALLRAGLIEPITPQAKQGAIRQAQDSLADLEREARGRAKSGAVNPDLELDIKRLRVRLAHMNARLRGDDPFRYEPEPGAVLRPTGEARLLDEYAPSVTPPPAPTPAAPPPGFITLDEARRIADEAARAAVAAALAAMPQPTQAPPPERRPRTKAPATQPADATPAAPAASAAPSPEAPDAV